MLNDFLKKPDLGLIEVYYQAIKRGMRSIF